MATVQNEFVADPIDRATYAEGQTLNAASLNHDAEQIANGQQRHSRYAHSAGVIAGLLNLVEIPMGQQARKYKLSPGAAIDNSGRLLLVGEDHPGVVTTVDAKSELHVWLKYAPIEIPRRTTSLGMARWSEIPELIVEPANENVNEITDKDSVYLGRFKTSTSTSTSTSTPIPIPIPIPTQSQSQSQCVQAEPETEVEVQFQIDSGRKYVSASGSRIESPSGQSRILLGPEVPRDTRRFAVGYFDPSEKYFKDAITWETTNAIHLKTQVNVTIERFGVERIEAAVLAIGPQSDTTKTTDDRSAEPVRPGVEFIGFSPNETKMPAGSIYLAQGKIDEQSFRELRISILDPGEKNNPQRYRCSIGQATQCAHGPDLCLQSYFPRGILSVLADGSVEVHENLRVYTDDKNKQPGLIISLQAPSDSSDPKPTAPVLTKALAFEPEPPTCILSGGILAISGALQNINDAAARSLKLYVTVIRKDDAIKVPLRFSLTSKQQLVKGQKVDLAAFFTDSQTPPATLQFPVTDDFGNTPLVNLLIVGVNDDNAIVQLQVEITPTSATPN